MRNARYIGADGCKGGRWVYVATDGRGAWTADVVTSIAELWHTAPHAERILLDVPIGLKPRGARACDAAARRLLGPRASSVFPSPDRWLLGCTNLEEADRLKAEREGRAVKIQRQMWNILPRIREVDAWLRATPRARGIVRECHPEVCFARLAGHPMGHNKKDAAGRAERLDALRPWVPTVDALLAVAMSRWPRSVLAADDLLDAVVAALCAAAPESELRSLPEAPEADEHGLPMEMVYRVPDRSHPALTPVPDGSTRPGSSQVGAAVQR